MPKITRSVEQVDEVRDQILDCAFKILDKNGYENLSMAKIGLKMKMTAANLYNYYANKDELLIAIHKKAFAMLYDKISYDVERTDTPLDRLKTMANSFVEFGMHNISIYDIMFTRPLRQFSDYIGTPQEALSSDEFRSSLKVLFYAVKIINDYRKTRPDLDPVEPRLLTIQTVSALHGIISLHNSGTLRQICDDQEFTIKTIIDSAIRCVTG